MKRFLFGKSKEDVSSQQDQVNAPSNTTGSDQRPEGKKMTKKSFSNRLFGSSTKNIPATDNDDSPPSSTHDYQPPLAPLPLPSGPHNSTPSNPSKVSMKQLDISPAEVPMDNRSASSLHDDDEYKRDVDEHTLETSDGPNRLTTLVTNPAHRMIAVPQDSMNLRKTPPTVSGELPFHPSTYPNLGTIHAYISLSIHLSM